MFDVSNAMVTFFECILPRAMICALERGQAALGKQKGEDLEVSFWLPGAERWLWFYNRTVKNKKHKKNSRGPLRYPGTRMTSPKVFLTVLIGCGEFSHTAARLQVPYFG